MKDDERYAVLLLQMGAPEGPEDIEPFLRNLFSDPAIIPLPGPSPLRRFLAGLLARRRAKRVRARYDLMGGGSPLVRITSRQAGALEEWLGNHSVPAVVRPVMRYSPPRAGEVIRELEEEGISRIIALSLYPHYSSATTASSIKDLESALGKKEERLVRTVDRWGSDPGYIELMAGWIVEEAKILKIEAGDNIRVIFSAHNLPEKLIQRGDPYLGEIRETSELVGGKLEGLRWHLSFQSAFGPMKWLEPTTEATIGLLANEGVDGIVIVPVSFVSDHIETLYDMDIVYRKQAATCGIPRYRRLRAFNDAPEFIEVLGRLIKKGVTSQGQKDPTNRKE